MMAVFSVVILMNDYTLMSGIMAALAAAVPKCLQAAAVMLIYLMDILAMVV
jgi:hypothetical protein